MVCKQHKVPTPKIDKNGLPPLKLPSRVPVLPYQLDHVTPPSHGHTNLHTKHEDHLNFNSDRRKQVERESLKVQELQRIVSDPSNCTQIIAEEETQAGMSEELAQMVKENEIILESIDQQLLELGPFAKDTFLSPPVAPKDDPGAFPITFMPPNYLSFPPPPGMDLIPMGPTTQGRSRRRGGRMSSLHQGPSPATIKAKRNSRGSETGSVSSPMASTPSEGRDSASPAAAKEPPKSKWRKVGSAGSVTKPPLQSRSSSDRLHNNLQSPILDGMSVLSPPVSSSPVAAPTSAAMPTSSKAHGSSISSPTIIPPASEVEMRSLFSNNQWDFVESPPQRDRDLSPANTHTPNSHHHHQHPAAGYGRTSSERGDSLLTQSLSSLNSENSTNDRHHGHAASRLAKEPHGTPMPHGADPIPRPHSRPHSHSSSPPNSHLHYHQYPPPHPDIHTLSLSTPNNEISTRHLVVSGGMPMVSRPNISSAHLTSAREVHNGSPLVTSATAVSEERTHISSASPLSEQPRSWVQRSSASPSLGGAMVDVENPLAADRRRRTSSTSSHRSGRLQSFEDSATQQQRFSPHTTKPHSVISHGQHGSDPKQPSTPMGSGGETKLGAAVNPYAAALWGAATVGQFPAPTQVVDPASGTTTSVPRFPFQPPAAPFLPGANWIQAPGAMIAAAPGLPSMRPAMLPFDPNSPYKPPFLGAPFLTAGQFRYTLPSAQGLKAFPGLTGVSSGGSGSGPASSSHPGTPTATVPMPFSQPALYPGLQSSSTLSAFKSLNDTNRSSPPILHPQHLLGVPGGSGSKDDKQQPGSELPMDKLTGLNMMQPPNPSAAALMAGTNINLMPYLGMNPMLTIGGVQPTSIGQQTPGGVNLFNPRLSTLAAAGVHTGSEGNLAALGTSKEAAAVHRTHQRRGSAASIDVTSLSTQNESPPSQARKGFPPTRNDAATTGGKWKPVTDHSPPVSQMVFNMSAPPSSPFAPSIIDSRALPISSHLMTTSSQLGRMLPLSFGTPPTHQQMRGGGRGTEGAGRGSPRGTPDKMKLRIHQVKNDDFKGKPDRRRRRWKKEITLTGPEQEKPVAPPPGKQTAAQMRRVRSDTVRRNSSTPPAALAEDKDEVLDVGDSSDNNYALNMLATMSTMQSREQNQLDAARTSFASPLTISTSLPSSEPSKNPLMHSPVSLAGAKSLLMLGKDVHMTETTKSDADEGDRTAKEVTNVESTAADSLLQLSGAVLQNISNSSGSSDQLEAYGGDSKEDDFASLRRESRSASYSAAEAMLMMGSSKESQRQQGNDSNVVTAEIRQSSPSEVFGNGAGQDKQQNSDAGEKGEYTSPSKSSNLSKKPRSLTIDSEATDTDSEATLTPQSPAKRILSTSCVDGGMEREPALNTDTDSVVHATDLKQTGNEPNSPSEAGPDETEKPCEDPLLTTTPESSADPATDQSNDKKSTETESIDDTDQQPMMQTSQGVTNIYIPPIDSAAGTPPTDSSVADNCDAPSLVSSSSHDIGQDGDADDSMPPRKRLKLFQNEEEVSVRETETEANWQNISSSSNSELDVTKMESASETPLKQTDMDKSPTCHLSSVMPEVQDMSTTEKDQHSVQGQQDEPVEPVEPVEPEPVEPAALSSAQLEDIGVDRSTSDQPNDKIEAETEDTKKDHVTEADKMSPKSADKVTSWSVFADVAEASCEEKDQVSIVEKTDDSEVKVDHQATACSSPPPSPPTSEDINNQSVEKIDVSAKPSSVSSVSSPPFTPDPPIEINVFEKLPPSPQSANKQEGETASKENHPTASSNPLSDKEPMQPLSGTPTSTGVSTTSDNTVSVAGGPQNRLAVSRSSLNRLQHRKHIISQASKLGKDGRVDGRKRLRPPTDSQARLFEVDSVPTTPAISTAASIPSAPPPSHSHAHPSQSAIKEKKGSLDRTREDAHPTSVRKLKRPGHSSSKPSLSVQKQSKHTTTSKYMMYICTCI